MLNTCIREKYAANYNLAMTHDTTHDTTHEPSNTTSRNTASAASIATSAYAPRFLSHSETVKIRGLNYHVRRWGKPGGRPIWLLHGWMDVSASYQFLADCLLALNPDLNLYAPDWRGYGKTDSPLVGGTFNDAYWFPDYLGDLDGLLKHYHGELPVDIIAHSRRQAEERDRHRWRSAERARPCPHSRGRWAHGPTRRR